MMKLSKKLLSFLLCAVMVLGSVAIGGGGFAEVLDAFSVKASAAKVTSYSQGDIIEFGWYPQSKETNTSITDALTSSAGNTLGWNSYGYYSGTGEWDDGQMTPSNYMRYTDVMYGNTKYRGVVFDSYRPYYTGDQSTTSTSTQYQEINGYTCGDIYWFKYEPIKWRVLDPATGMVMAETILDSQAYNNYILSSGTDEYGYTAFWGDAAKTYYANNYAKSSIREWLNKDFYNTAFSPAQQNIIQNTILNNSAYSTSCSEYNSVSTNDKIYLLSYNDVLNTSYGFSSSTSVNDTSREAKGSDYAKCQGLDVCNDGEEYDGNSFWRLRSPGGSSSGTCRVFYDGCVSSYFGTYSTLSGVRPALNFNLSSETFQSDVKDTGTASGSGMGTAAASGTGSNDGWADSTHIRFGSYPQTDVTSSMGETLDAKATDWKSYKYYSGTGEEADGQMSSADYMMYCDVTVMNGSVPEKYRGVKFSTYRPYWTEDASTSSCGTFQDDNGYTIGNTYWFRYEPLVWRVLGTEDGGTIVMSENIIDSQAFNNYILSADSKYWGDSGKTYYASNYSKSSLRDWLINDFYSTAFSSTQQSKIMTRECDNSCYSSSYPEYDSQNSSDKVFLLSYDEVKTAAYGFNSSASTDDSARRAKGTDYAKCQGLWVSKSSESEYDGNSWWWLRSPNDGSHCACEVSYGGYSYNYCNVDGTSNGVRPALKLNLTSDYETLKNMKDEAKAELAEAKNNAVSDEAKTILDNAIASVENAADVNDIVAITSNAKSDAENADKGLADAKAAAKAELETAKNNAKSDEAKSALDTAIANVDKATNLNDVAEAKLNGLTNAENAEKTYDEKTKFDKVSIKTATEKAIDYRSIVTITATAENVPDDCKLAIYLGSQKVAEGNNKSVSYEYGEIKSDINYTVKVVDANGNVQKDSNGNELTKDGGKITMKKTFFGMIIAFFKSLFNLLPKVEVKPQ